MNIAKLRSEINLHQTVSKLEQRWDNDGISLIILSLRVKGEGFRGVSFKSTTTSFNLNRL